MTLAEATALIDHDSWPLAPTTWADLGAGSGTFTLALADRLPPGSVIHAVDRERSAFAGIPNQHRGVTIHKHVADFLQDGLPFGRVDGLLMANALHYVRDKEPFLKRVGEHLTETGRFLIVEYDTDTPHPPWVPYPLSYPSLVGLFERLGFASVRRLGEKRSIYQRANLYGALVC